MQSTTNAVKATSKKAIQKTAEATGDLTGSKISYKIAKVSKPSPQNNSVTNEEETLREKYVSPEERQNVNDDLRLI